MSRCTATLSRLHYGSCQPPPVQSAPMFVLNHNNGCRHLCDLQALWWAIRAPTSLPWSPTLPRGPDGTSLRSTLWASTPRHGTTRARWGVAAFVIHVG
jgi:hypothetical protein